MNTTADTDALRHIGKILVDQTRLYARAADIADAPEAAPIQRACRARAVMLDELNGRLADLGAERIEEGTMRGAGHKAFLSLRAGVDKDSRAAVGEVERGEDYLRDQVADWAGKDGLSGSTRDYLNDLLFRIAPTHDEIAELKQTLHRHGAAIPLGPGA